MHFLKPLKQKLDFLFLVCSSSSRPSVSSEATCDDFEHFLRLVQVLHRQLPAFCRASFVWVSVKETPLLTGQYTVCVTNRNVHTITKIQNTPSLSQKHEQETSDMCWQNTFQQFKFLLSPFATFCTPALWRCVSSCATDRLSTSDPWPLTCKTDHAAFVSEIQVCCFPHCVSCKNKEKGAFF